MDAKNDINFERLYWEKARRNFKQASKDKDDEKKRDEFLKERSTPQEAKELCKATQKRASDEYSPSLGGILEKIEIAMSVGDLAIKSAPESVGLAWMGIRLCLHSVADDYATFSIFGAAASDIISIMISCAIFGRMYGPSRGIDSFQEIHTQVTDRIPLIYTEILDFSFEVKKHMSRSKLRRLGKGLVMSASAEFGMKIKCIKDHDLAMAELARRAHEQLNDYYNRTGQEKQEEMLSSLTDIRSKLEMSAQVNEEYRQQLRALMEELGKRKELTPHDVAVKGFEENVKALDAISDQEGTYDAKLRRRSPPQTCTWIFENDAFKSWSDSEKSEMLWVSGGGGFGKSILMAAVVHEIQQRSANQGALVQYFFCNAGDDTTKRTERILNHLLHQVYQLVAQLPTETMEKSNKLVSNYLKGNKNTKSSQGDSKKEDVSFGDAFRGIVQLLGKPAYVMVDALDECTDRSKGLVPSLRELIEEPHPLIKVVVCSRPEVDGLDNIATIKVEGNNGPDIKLNAETELAKLPSFTARERELATTRIVEKAGSYFRYVDLAIEFLKQPWQRPLHKHLEQLPQGLEAFYEQIVRKTDPAYLGLLKTCLTWTILADGKVHVSEVIDVFSRVYVTEDEDPESSKDPAHDPEYFEPPEDDRHSDDLFITQIRAAGSALLDVDNSTKVIQLRHNTVADHFLQTEPGPKDKDTIPSHQCETCRTNQKSADKFVLTEKLGHLSIAIVILKHLQNENFRQRYIVPFERTELKRNHEGRPDGYETTKETDTGESAKEDVPVAPANAEQLSPESEVITEAVSTEGEENIREDTPAKPDDDAASDAASEDSDVDEIDMNYVFSPIEDDTRAYRYEVSYCAYHLQRVEELLTPEDRTGDEWEQFETLRAKFFQDDSPYFRSWVNLLNQTRYGALSAIDDTRTVHPIHLAALYGQSSLVKKLLQEGVDLTLLTDDGHSPLDFAIEYHTGARKGINSWYDNSIELFRILLQAGANVNAIPARLQRTPFHALFWYNPGVEVVRLFLDHGANLHDTDSTWKLSVLHIFCLVCDHVDVLKELLERGAKTDAIDQGKETPLHYLMRRSEVVPVEFVKMLIEAGADVNAEDEHSQMPLRELCLYNGSVDAANLLIEAGADIHDKDVSHQTALHTAAENGYLDVVKLLVEKKAELGAADDRGCTPLYKACGANSDDCALYMIHCTEEHINESAKNGKTPLHKAAAKGHRKIVEAIFERSNRDASVLESKSNRQRTPLHGAARFGRKDVVEYLLQQGVSVTVQDKEGKTPLRACFDGWSEARSKDYEAVCVLLLESVQAAELGTDLLHIAAARGSLAVVRALMGKGADPLTQDEHGWTSIQIAQHFHKEDVVELLSTTRAIIGHRPSALKNNLPKFLQLSEDKLEVTRTSTHKVAITAQHPVPAGVSSFYFEIEVDASLREDDKTTEPEVGLGFCVQPPKPLRNWFPGWAWPFGLTSWGYHGDDGLLLCCPYKGSPHITRYGHGDTIGCGLDTKNDRIFFTKNGALLEIEKGAAARPTYYAFTGVTGRLYPVIGIGVPGVRVKVNFGNDVVSRPFVWEPGNGAGNGIGLVGEREKGLARTPPVLLRRRTTVAIGDALAVGVVGEGEAATGSGAEAATEGGEQVVVLEVSA